MNAQGADYSLWQDDNSTSQRVDFSKARQSGLSFAMIKTSQANWLDPDFIINWANAKGQLYRGAYHFLTWDVDPKRQAETLWAALEKDPPELGLWMDFEWWKTVPENAISVLNSALMRLKSLTELPIGIYTSAAFWHEAGNPNAWWKQFKLWLCDIQDPVDVPPPWGTWDFHQYTFKLNGPLYGAESKDLDGDQYNGPLEKMIADFGLKPLDQLPNVETATIRNPYRYDGVNLRAGEGTKSKVLAYGYNGTPVRIINQDDGWSKVQLDAYIRSDMLK